MGGHPIPKDVQIDYALSNFGVQALMLNANLVSSKIAPVVSVDKVAGTWYKKTPREGVQVQHQDLVPDGGETTETNFTYEQGSYATQERGRHHKLSDRTRQNRDMVLPEEELSGMTDIMHGMATTREVLASDIALTQANYPAGHWIAATAAWDLPTTNPRHDVNTAVRIIELASGYRGNFMVCPPLVYDILTENEYIADFIRYQNGVSFLQTGRIPDEQLYSLQLVKCGSVYDAAAPLKAMNLGYIWERATTDAGDDWCLICFVDPVPSIKTGSFMSTFAFNPRILSDQDFGQATTWYDSAKKATFYEFRADYQVLGTNMAAAVVIHGIKSPVSS